MRVIDSLNTAGIRLIVKLKIDDPFALAKTFVIDFEMRLGALGCTGVAGDGNLRWITVQKGID